ncbi:MAG TPA: response regulator [Candidatus Dormibacteraeota bacterium]|nr:response regulator [Candidatus Dormibacteraeota bacterium]
MELESLTKRKSSVLCIDDEQSNLTVRKLLLESAGYFVLTASGGKEGMDIFRSNLVDAVVVDYSMPEMDGSMVAARVKEIKPRIPVIMLSAYPGAQDTVNGFVDAFIEKGGEPKDLLRRLESLIRLRSHSHPELKSEYVVFVDASRRFSDCSDGVCKLLGYSRLELLDKAIEDISYEPESLPPLFKQFPRLGSLHVEHILRSKGGRPILIRFHSWVFPDGCMAAVCNPVTNWKEMYQAALVEVNPSKLKKRVEVALLAIHQRMRELEQTPSKLTGESVALNDALSGLRVLLREIQPGSG